jgi:hypothetical protein
MLSAFGKIHVNRTAKRVVVDLSPDFVPYYIWHFKKTHWLNLHSPMHCGHITLANSKLHPKADYQQAADIFHGQVVSFDYDPNIIRGGRTKGFEMFYIKVFSKELDRIKRKIKVIDNAGYRGLHITLGNLNKSGQTPMQYWPEMIKIKK